MTLRIGRTLIKGNLLDLEGLVLPPIALKVLEPMNGHPRVACDEMQQMFQLQLTQPSDKLPEPPNKLITRCAVGVLDIVLEIFQIDLLFAVDHHVQLMRLEHTQQLGRNDLVYAAFEVLEQTGHAGCGVVVAAELEGTYSREMYSSLLLELTIVLNPFSFRGTVISVPCSSTS